MYHIKIFSTTTDDLKHDIPNVSMQQYDEIEKFITRRMGDTMYSITYPGLTPYILHVENQNSGANIFCKHINEDTYNIIALFLLGQHSSSVGSKSKGLGLPGTHSHFNFNY
jgi:hypothetical protein